MLGGDREAQHLEPGAGEFRTGQFFHQAATGDDMDTFPVNAGFVDEPLTQFIHFARTELDIGMARNYDESRESWVARFRVVQIIRDMAFDCCFVLGSGRLNTVDAPPRVDPSIRPTLA